MLFVNPGGGISMGSQKNTVNLVQPFGQHSEQINIYIYKTFIIYIDDKTDDK